MLLPWVSSFYLAAVLLPDKQKIGEITTFTMWNGWFIPSGISFLFTVWIQPTDHYHSYNSFINANEIVLIRTLPDWELSCKFEERNPFSSRLMRLPAAPRKSPREGYLNINKPRGRVWSKSLRSQEFAAERRMTQTDGSSQSLDSENETRGKSWEGWNLSELKRVVFLSERGGGGVRGLCLPLLGDSDRLKTGIYGRGSYF